MNQLKKIERWKDWAPALMDKVIGRINILSKITGSKGIRVQTSPTGIHLSSRIPSIKRKVVAGADICFERVQTNTDAGATATITVDRSSGSTTVYCDIFGGGNLEDALPHLQDNDWMLIWYDTEESKWRNHTTITNRYACP